MKRVHMEAKDFDKLMKNKLKSLDIEQPANAWDDFEKQLSSHPTADAFDQSVKDGLHMLPIAEADGSLWERMEQTLDAEPLQAADFDKRIQRKAQQVRPQTVSEHWLLLAARLRQIAVNRSFYVRTKLIEFIAFLCILTFVQFGYEPSPSAQRLATAEGTEQLTPASENNLTHQLTNQTQPQLKGATITDLNINSSIQEVIKKETPQTATAGKERSLEESVHSSTLLSKTTYNKFGNTEAQFFSPLPLRQAKALELTPYTENLSASLWRTFVDEDLALDRLPTHVPAFPTSQKVGTPWLVVTPSSARPFQLEAFASYDRHQIFTPGHQELAFADTRHAANGFGGGLALTYQRARWSYTLSLSMHHLKYEPPAHEERYNEILQGRFYQTDALQFVSLNILQVPLFARYHFVQQPKFSAYVIGGLGMRMVTLSGYQRQTGLSDLRFLPPGFIPVNGLPDASSLGSDVSYLSQLEYTEGFFEGGEFQKTATLTAHLGAGLSYRINKDLGFFTEPIWQQTLGNPTFGPMKDRMHAFSLRTGLRFYLP